MSNIGVIGSSFGDCGKGRIIDFLARNADMVVRYNGGGNAGHTVKVKDIEYNLHLVPSGILYDNVICIIGNGVVIDLIQLEIEIDELEEKGINTDKLYISNRAHVVLPTHRVRDQDTEFKNKNKIGTTGKGIGPAYMDKVGRFGIRVGDFSASEEQIRQLIIENWNNTIGKAAYQTAETYALAHDLKECYEKLKHRVIDASSYINRYTDYGSNILFEGAQGTGIDVDFGTYPYVSSSSSCAGGICVGAGIGPTKIDHIVGVAKAYTTRVGEGPFPTELISSIGNELRERGKEYGTTTGRARRCGWLDLIALKHAINVSGISSIALTKLDVLSGIGPINICVSYEIDGERTDLFPASRFEFKKIKPIYKTFEGWFENLSNVRSLDKLPSQVRKYIGFIEEMLNIQVSLIGVGPERDEILGPYGKLYNTGFVAE